MDSRAVIQNATANKTKTADVPIRPDIALSEKCNRKIRSLSLETGSLSEEGKLEERTLLYSLSNNISAELLKALNLFSSLKPFLNKKYIHDFLKELHEAQKQDVQAIDTLCKKTEPHAIRADICSTLINTIKNMLQEKDILHLSEKNVRQLSEMLESGSKICYAENAINKFEEMKHEKTADGKNRITYHDKPVDGFQLEDDFEVGLIASGQTSFIFSTQNKLINLLQTLAKDAFYEMQAVSFNSVSFDDEFERQPVSINDEHESIVNKHRNILKELTNNRDQNPRDPEMLGRLLTDLQTFIKNVKAVTQTVDFKKKKAEYQIFIQPDSEAIIPLSKTLYKICDSEDLDVSAKLEQLNQLNAALTTTITIQSQDLKKSLLIDIIDNLTGNIQKYHLSRKQTSQLYEMKSKEIDDDTEQKLFYLLYDLAEKSLNELKLLSFYDDYLKYSIERRDTLIKLITDKNDIDSLHNPEKSKELLSDLQTFISETWEITQTVDFQIKKAHKQIANLSEPEKTAHASALFNIKEEKTSDADKLKKLTVLNAYINANSTFLFLAQFLNDTERTIGRTYLEHSHKKSLEEGTPEHIDFFISRWKHRAKLKGKCHLLITQAKNLYDSQQDKALKLNENEIDILQTILREGSVIDSENDFINRNQQRLLDLMASIAYRKFCELFSKSIDNTLKKDMNKELAHLQNTNDVHKYYENIDLEKFLKNLYRYIDQCETEINKLVPASQSTVGFPANKRRNCFLDSSGAIDPASSHKPAVFNPGFPSIYNKGR